MLQTKKLTVQLKKLKKQVSLQKKDKKKEITRHVLCCAQSIHSYDPMDCGPPGSFVHGILQAKILEWVAIPVSRGSSQLKDQTRVSCITEADFLPTEPPGKPP